ncbi:MAG: TrmH family RNA methyltransferase [Lentihominibacter sp.]
MKIITSKDNQLYKTAFRLTKKKYRDEYGMYLLEGVKPLLDALGTGISVRNIFLCDGMTAEADFPDEITVKLDRKLFERLSDTGTSQGVIAVAEKLRYDYETFSENAGMQGSNIVVLDRLQDPGNIGTIVRTAEAAGYRGIIATAGSGDIYSPKVVRAAAGSLFRVPVLQVDDSMEAVNMLRKMNKRIVTAALDTDIYYYQTDLTENIALVIGNEGQGVSEVFMKSSDIKVRIPMEGSIESLNAAVAAGILMYQSQKINR